MANNPIGMQKVKQILLLLKREVSQRNIAVQVKVSRPTVRLYMGYFEATGHSYEALLNLEDQELHQLIEAQKEAPEELPDPRKRHFLENFDYFKEELGGVGVTRLLLWEEYKRDYPSGYGYSRFCELFDAETKRTSPTMTFHHTPAELVEFDFAGDKLSYVDTSTGEIIECPVLIGVLPFSNLGYAKALPNASLPQVITALNDTLDYFGGVPLNAKSDNMKQWVTRSCRYEPTFPKALEQWSLHNQIGLLATRVARPKDKPSVEKNVLDVYRRVYAVIRKDTFYSIGELNQAVLRALEAHHDKHFQRKDFSRRELFNDQEKPLLQSLPQHRFKINHTTQAKVQQNYHVVIGEDWHYYSVPFQYLGEDVKIIYDGDNVEIYLKLNRIAVHRRSYRRHGFTTLLEHMPEHHRQVAIQRGWTPEYYMKKAKENGPHTYEMFEKIIKSRITIHQAYGPFKGILRLMKDYGGVRVEAACKRALTGNRHNYKVVQAILEKKLDLMEEPQEQESPIPQHGNLRGPEAFINKMKNQ